MSFSTAELFQTSSSNDNKSQIRKGNSVKINNNNFVYHVPHNSHTEHYRFYDDVVNGNGHNIFKLLSFGNYMNVDIVTNNNNTKY